MSLLDVVDYHAGLSKMDLWFTVLKQTKLLHVFASRDLTEIVSCKC